MQQKPGGKQAQLVGVDAQGRILTPPSVPLAPAFAPLMEDLRQALSSQLQDLLHSVYVYGSVAQGTAVAGRSDLDLTLVLQQPASPAAERRLQALRAQLLARHSMASKIDFDLGHLEQVMHAAQRLRWGYWIKHHCRCIWGPDLALDLPAQRPSREIALAVNGDFADAMDDYVQRIAQEPQAQPRLQREAARKLIRASNMLRPLHGGGWPQTLDQHLQQLRQQSPALASALEWLMPYALAHCGQNSAPPTALFNERLLAASQALAQALADQPKK